MAKAQQQPTPDLSSSGAFLQPAPHAACTEFCHKAVRSSSAPAGCAASCVNEQARLSLAAWGHTISLSCLQICPTQTVGGGEQ